MIEPLERALSPRGRAFLRATESGRDRERTSRAAIAARFAELGADFVAAAAAFEARYGGWRIDMKENAIELGIGHLLARDIEPAIDRDERVVLVGMAENEDVYLPFDPERLATGRLYVARMDREVGELASSVEKWVERVAALAAPPFEGRPFVFNHRTSEDPFASGLSLVIDDIASDATFTLASADGLVLERDILGTSWTRGRGAMICQDFARLVRVLEVAHTAGVRGGVASGLPTMTDTALKEPLDRAGFLRELEPETRFVVEDEDDDAKTHVMKDARIEAYRCDGEGRVVTHLTLHPKGGTQRQYIEPW